MASGVSEGTLLAERYRLERILGTGGMASVWLAHDKRLGRPVAVKLLSDSLAHDESYLRRFRREAQLAAGLSHPNLVKVYDFGGKDERPYLVMEYVQGETLARRIADGTAVELDPGRSARELLGALDHIHAASIVHRDIKPANVLIAPDGSAKVTDFGIAQPEDATRLTSTGLVIGTRSYMAPEVLSGEPATVRSDLYSCAMVLQEAFGDLPPPGLAGLVGRLSDEDPSRRPESASQALASLAASGAPTGTGAAATAPTAPLPPDRTTPTIPIGGGMSRTRLLGGVALLATLIVGILLLGGGDEAPSPDSGRDSAVQDEERRPGEQGRAAEADDAASTEEAAGPTETPESTARPDKADKAKGPNPSRSRPGKAKGLNKR